MVEKIVSVVLPVYNGEKRVSNAIKSILEQTYQNLELIIVNDCSTDGTKNVITKFASEDSRIKLVNNETNQKLPKSLNIGFSYASGKYLTWTSDDNAFKPEAIMKMAEYLDEHDDIRPWLRLYMFLMTLRILRRTGFIRGKRTGLLQAERLRKGRPVLLCSYNFIYIMCDYRTSMIYSLMLYSDIFLFIIPVVHMEKNYQSLL